MDILKFINDKETRPYVDNFIKEYFAEKFGTDDAIIISVNGTKDICEIWLDLIYGKKIKQGRYVMTEQTYNKIIQKI